MREVVGFGMLGTRTSVSCPVKNQRPRDLRSGFCDCGQQGPGGSGSGVGLQHFTERVLALSPQQEGQRLGRE